MASDSDRIRTDALYLLGYISLVYISFALYNNQYEYYWICTIPFAVYVYNVGRANKLQIVYTGVEHDIFLVVFVYGASITFT